MKRLNFTFFCFFLFGLMIHPLFSADWQVMRNDSVRIFYARGNRFVAETTLQTTDKALAEITARLKIPFSGEVNIFLAEDEKSWQKLTNKKVPEWSQAVTKPEVGIVYVSLAKKNGKELPVVLRHELVHVLIGKNFSPGIIPRWFEEGVAMIISGENFSNYISTLSKANLTNSLLTLPEIENVLRFQQSKANLAYAESYFSVKMIVDALGWDALSDILKKTRKYNRWERAFDDVLEMNQESFQWHVFKEVGKKYRWNFIFQSDIFFWVILPFIAIIAFIFVRIRNYRTYRRWEEDEMEAAAKDEENE
ncbi:MAG TPA: hypothetical protein ENH29_09695 [Bacteroidetes bacterium]|nr:hypothetical protein [Bacteroidota bacterium]